MSPLRPRERRGPRREFALVSVGHAAHRGVCGGQISSLQSRVAGGALRGMKSAERGADAT